MIRNIYQKPTASIIVNCEKLLATAFNVVLEGLANPVRQEKEMHTDRKEKIKLSLKMM